jgi:hypothetical protein
VCAEVEKDTSFTTTAWILAAVVVFLNRLGSLVSPDLSSWLIGAVGGTILAVLGFAVGVLVVNWVGRSVFDAEVSFDQRGPGSRPGIPRQGDCLPSRGLALMRKGTKHRRFLGFAATTRVALAAYTSW